MNDIRRPLPPDDEYTQAHAAAVAYVDAVDALRRDGLSLKTAVKQHHNNLRRQGVSPPADGLSEYQNARYRVLGAGRDGRSAGYEPTQPPPQLLPGKHQSDDAQRWYVEQVHTLVDSREAKNPKIAAARVTGWVHRVMGLTFGCAGSAKQWDYLLTGEDPPPRTKGATRADALRSVRQSLVELLFGLVGVPPDDIEATAQLLAEAKTIDEFVATLDALASEFVEAEEALAA